MAYEAGHAGDYPETAGWALGALSPADEAAFGEHLRSCEYCQAQVTGFTAAASGLAAAAPASEPPGDLELKVVAAVQYAAMAEGASALVPAAGKGRRAGTRARRWWHPRRASPLYAGLAAAAVTAAAFTGSTLLRGQPEPVATVSLRAQPGYAGSGTVTVRPAQGGFEISLTVNNLPVLGPGQFYECWYAGPGSRPGHPELITAGTFAMDSAGSHTFSLLTAADPAQFKMVQVTLEQPGSASQHGKVILSGTAQP